MDDQELRVGVFSLLQGWEDEEDTPKSGAEAKE